MMFDPTTPTGLALIWVVLAAAFLVFKLVLKPGGGAKHFLDKSKGKQELVLVERTALSRDTVRFRFGLPKATPVLGLPVGKHFKVFAPNPKGVVAGQWNGREDPEAGQEEIERKYTPVTSNDDLGYVDLVIKVYTGGEKGKPQFPDGGKMSQYMHSLRVGQTLTLTGPVGMNEYLGPGRLKKGSNTLTFKTIGMLAGGTGITPMLQLMVAVLKDPKDTTSISLLYANQTEDDILVRDLLEGLAKRHPERLKVWYTVDKAKPGWKYSEGFISDTMIAEHLPGPDEQPIILMCGPPPMIKFACKANLDKLGYPASAQVAF